MEKNLFQQAKDLWDDFVNDDTDHEEHAHSEQDKAAVKEAIQAAYQDASPEQQQKLTELENHLEERLR